VKRRLIGCAAALAALAGALPAAAHSLLLESGPAANATVTAPGRIVLRFNNRIEAALSRVRLLDEHGAHHDLSPALAPGTLDRLVADAPPLTPGRYRVEWQVLSTDGHVVSGRYSFRVAP
jgi:copper resistance protein C